MPCRTIVSQVELVRYRRYPSSRPIENTSPKKNQSYCRCSEVQASDDRKIAPATPSLDSDQPRYRNPREKISSHIGAATQNAIARSHSAPSACADLSTSPMKPGVTSRPSARDSRSQPPTRMASAATPMKKWHHEVQ